MNYSVFSEKTTGYKNIKKGLKSQDFLAYQVFEDSIICSVADGHSTSYFKYSDKGAKFACEASISILKEYINKDLKYIRLNLENETIQKHIYDKWIYMVEEDYRKSRPIVFKTEFIKYSTTLISVLITDQYTLYLKIGDGNIFIKKNGNYINPIKLNNKKVVDSFGRKDMYKNIKYYIDEDYFSNIILFTDGYENSFKNRHDLIVDIDDTIYKYNKDIFSRNRLYYIYKKHLIKLSNNSTNDDISIIYIFNNI